MKKKSLKTLSLNKKIISRVESSSVKGGGTSAGSPCASEDTFERCASIGPKCGGLTFDYFCREQ